MYWCNCQSPGRTLIVQSDEEENGDYYEWHYSQINLVKLDCNILTSLDQITKIYVLKRDWTACFCEYDNHSQLISQHYWDI